MEKQQIIATWVTEKFGMNQQEIVNFLLENAVESIAKLPEFQDWLKTQQAQLKAQSTPEALEAQKMQAEAELKKKNKLVDEMIAPVDNK
jgi:phosphoribosyl-dephospho-CoA transferase